MTSQADARLRRLDDILTGSLTSGARRGAAFTSAVAAVAVIAMADYATGVRLSLSVFYLIPVAATAVWVSPKAALWMAMWAAAAWSLADAEIETARSSALLQLWNGILRLCTLAFAVALISGLRRALQRSRASERRSKEFLAYAAHQLRTPVAGVRASAEALVLTDSPTVREQLAANLTAEADRIGRLVHSLLRLARLDQGERPAQRPCQLERLLQSELERLRVLAPSLELEFHVRPEVPASVVVDPPAVAEIVANLLDNARRHAVECVEVTVEYAANTVCITVSDDGAGLPAGAEDRAFDRFVSLDGHGGSGLGLAIARSLAEAQGGGLEYSSRRFVVTLQAPSADGHSPSASEAQPGALDHRHSG